MAVKYYTAYIDDINSEDPKNLKNICETIAYNLSIRNYILRTTRMKNNQKNYFETGCDKDNGKKEIYVHDKKFLNEKENIIYVEEVYNSLNSEIKLIFDNFISKTNFSVESINEFFSFTFSLIGHTRQNKIIKFSKFFIFYTKNEEKDKILKIMIDKLGIPSYNLYKEINNPWVISDFLQNFVQKF